jgi:DNA ligase-1
MLADDSKKHESKLKGQVFVEPKLDGVRVIAICDIKKDEVILMSRNGKELVNFPHIVKAFEDNIDNFARSYVFDGEVMSSSFQALMTQVHRKSDVKSDDAVLHLFDIVPLVEFKAGKSVMGQRRRSQFLKNFENIFADSGCIALVPQQEVDLDTFMGGIEFQDFNKAALAAGKEGIMIKDVDAKYETKRSVSWLKQKPFIEVSLTVIAVEEGTGRNVAKLGALVCEGEDDGKAIKVNVGSGFTDSDRDEYWTGKEMVLGQVVEVRADAITQNQDGTYSLRFPRFLRFRGFKAGEKI